MALKDNAISYCFTLFTLGGPCHLSSFKQCSLFIQLRWEKNVRVFIFTSLNFQILHGCKTTQSNGLIMLAKDALEHNSKEKGHHIKSNHDIIS